MSHQRLQALIEVVNKQILEAFADIVEMEVEKVYEVEQLIAKRIRKGKVEYKIRWKGFQPSEDTWESNILAGKELLIEDFNQKH